MRKIGGEVEVKSVSEHGENIAPEIMPKTTHATGKMPATSRIPVSIAVWEELSDLKSAGETYDHLLAEMIEKEKMGGYLRIWTALRKGVSLWR